MLKISSLAEQSIWQGGEATWGWNSQRRCEMPPKLTLWLFPHGLAQPLQGATSVPSLGRTQGSEPALMQGHRDAEHGQTSQM